MISPHLVAAADGIAANATPEALGYGYADTQFPWQYDPAIDLDRETTHRLLQILQDHAPHGRYALRGESHRGSLARVLGLIGAHIHEGPSPSPLDAAVLRGPGIPTHWLEATANVRPGGVVALIECGASEDTAETQWITALERDVLRPAGIPLQRFGNDAAVHFYLQPSQPAQATPRHNPAEQTPSAPHPAGTHLEFDLWLHEGVHWASPNGEPPPTTAARQRNQHTLLLRAASSPALKGLVDAWCAAQQQLEHARNELAEANIQTARDRVLDLRRALPTLADQLCGLLRWSPHSRALLTGAGVLELFGPHPAKGAALLRQALEQAMMDSALLRTVGNAYLHVLDDRDAAKALAETVRREVQRRNLAHICHTELSGHVLWKYPRALEGIRGVIQVGAHTGDLVPAWRRLGIQNQCYLEPNPEAFAQLRHTIDGDPNAVAWPMAASDESGTNPLYIYEHTASASMLQAHPLTGRQPSRSLDVPCETLDALAASGHFDPELHNLLFLNTEGTELDILRGATAVLRHVDLIAVALCLAPTYEGAPLPQQIQGYLASLDDGFGLTAFEPVVDPSDPTATPSRGNALFRRLKRRTP